MRTPSKHSGPALSPSVASTVHPRRHTGWSSRDLALIAVFAALVAAFSVVPGIPVGPLGVPITLQTLAILVTAITLGGARGGTAVLLYCAVGLAGVPIFAKFSGGPALLAGPSAGYIVAFPIAALVAGGLATLVLRRMRRFRFPALFATSLLTSAVVVHPLGILGMSINGKLSFEQAFLYDLPFWPGDVIKTLLATGIALTVLKAFPRLADRRF